MTVSRHTHLECARCGTEHDRTLLHNRCACGGTLLARYDLKGGISLAEVRRRPPGLWRYRELLPVEGEPVSLGEAETPLLPLPAISERFGVEVLLKDDGLLPTGTFKARGAAVGVTRAVELGAPGFVMPSAGNAGGAWAAYATRARRPITITMAVSAPQMNQTEVGLLARLETVEGTISEAGKRAREIAESDGLYPSATFNEPFRVEGKKTAWLETFDRLGDETSMRLPGTIITSVGGGVAAVAAHKAANEVLELGWAEGDVPRIVGVQSDDCAPIVAAFDAGDDEAGPWTGAPTTIAAGLRVPAPSEGYLVLRAVRESGGSMLAVPEERIIEAVGELARLEGVLVCPEGATALLALERLCAAGEVAGPVVLYNTGAGIKYLEMLAR